MRTHHRGEAGYKHSHSLYTCLCQIYPLYSPLYFFTHFSFFISSLLIEALEQQPVEDRHQNQTTVTRTRQQPFERPASKHHRRFESIRAFEWADLSPKLN